ncbi:NIPSNAP family protein [Anatilimnocola sp. NA78]|uniref:NIPSNAP family protein n=1 Tax=Anatilimnocola sp. NA78 TaxID=3415683 RepID=UPI003CE5B390
MIRRHFQLLFASVALLALGFAASHVSAVAQEKAVPRVYELRTYTTHPGRLPALNKRFQEHTLKLFEKHGMKNEMYWIPTDSTKSENTLIYVISHESEAAAKKSWDAFRTDPDWIKARDASEADGKIVLKVESVFMTKAPYSP